jgi:hypothetical protein
VFGVGNQDADDIERPGQIAIAVVRSPGFAILKEIVAGRSCVRDPGCADDRERAA